MKEKGFTLIELLAVIVILAIIALIATPIVLNIIEDSKDSSRKRSIDGYANAVEYAVANSQLENATGKISGTFTTEDGKILIGNTTLTVDYDGDVVCDTIEVYSDGNIYLNSCKVNGEEVDYVYGSKKVVQAYKPQYYYFPSDFYPKKIGDDLPSSAKENILDIDTQGNSYYIGLDVDSNNKVSAAYSCFNRNETEYCFKGADLQAYETNIEILNTAFSDELDNCSFDDERDRHICNVDGLDVIVYSTGRLLVGVVSLHCDVSAEGHFQCAAG